MASTKIHDTLVCLYCGKRFHSAMRLAHHLDTCHQGWVEVILARIGVEVPRTYPVPEYRKRSPRPLPHIHPPHSISRVAGPKRRG